MQVWGRQLVSKLLNLLDIRKSSKL